MIPVAAVELARLLGGDLVGSAGDINGFALDSREAGPGIAFLAIRGAHVDGHDFVAQALKSGAALTVAERPVNEPYIEVRNLVIALAQMAASYRSSFTGPVVGVTGSAGKTTAKEFVAAALAGLGPVLKTEANRNTEYTVPLLWAELTPEHRSAVVEMGMRGFGQIAHLARISAPDVAIVTNVGWAHIDLVGSRDGIARAKGELLQSLSASGQALLWAEDDYLALLRELAPGRALTFGFEAGADSRITEYEALTWGQAEVSGVTLNQPWHALLAAAGRHVAIDAAASVLAASVLGVSAQEAADRIADAKLPPMRMETRQVALGTVLLDAYNASPPSVIAALQTLMDVPTNGRHLAVLGEMKELGAFSEEAHRAVGRAVAELGLDEVLFFGGPTRVAWEEAIRAGAAARFTDRIEDATGLIAGLKEGDVVLVKGSRGVALERALEPLEGVK